MKKLLLLFALFFVGSALYSQDVYQPLGSGVYEYLDELANEGIIGLNTAVKPYPRRLIAEKLTDAEAKKEELNPRQLKELEFYLKDFNKEAATSKDFDRRRDLYFYRDSLFSFTLNPILGGRYYVNDNGSAYHRWNGAELYGSIGKLGFAASLRDNGISEDLFGTAFLVKETGGNYKVKQGDSKSRYDFSEMQGGISYGWKWGAVAIRKDNFVWGNNYNGANIFSGKQPSFAYISLKLKPVKWFDFNYIHGWVVSQVVDSARSYFINGNRRRVFHDKYLAANLFTFTPVKKLNFSFGNSVVYGDVGANPAYLIPFFFFKSVDHTYNGTGSNDLGQNSQMFFDISSRQIKKVHLYASLFVDEVSISNMFDKDEHTNIWSAKIGARVSNVLIPNISLTAEYTRSNPWAYQHQIAVTTFASNEYNMGHYLRDNADEIYLGILYKPIRGLHLNLSYTRALKGDETAYDVINGIPQVKGLEFIENVAWLNKTVSFKITYEVINDGWIYLEYINGFNSGDTETFTPEIFRGSTNTVIAGINFGF